MCSIILEMVISGAVTFENVFFKTCPTTGYVMGLTLFDKLSNYIA